jgi:hypothetical protein
MSRGVPFSFFLSTSVRIVPGRGRVLVQVPVWLQSCRALVKVSLDGFSDCAMTLPETATAFDARDACSILCFPGAAAFVAKPRARNPIQKAVGTIFDFSSDMVPPRRLSAFLHIFELFAGRRF